MTAERQPGAGGTRSTAPKPSRWPRLAAAVARHLSIDQLHAAALAEIRRAAGAGEIIAIACSGGADSVALVCTLWAHVTEARGRWLILHFDHCLRGRASTGDARFVAALANGLGEQCVVGRWVEKGEGAATESMAREARFAFFSRAMHTAQARVLVLGHQADDVVETMLMRLVRGSAAGGLSAPRPVHRRRDGTTRVRPLLSCRGAGLRAALVAARVPWREDSTNAGDAYFRNRLRRRVLPALKRAAERDIVDGFLAAREALQEDDDALLALLSEYTSRGWAALRGRPRALARRAVHAWLHEQDPPPDLSRRAVDGLIDAVVAGTSHRCSVGAGRFVVFGDGDLRLISEVDPQVGWGEGVVLEIGGDTDAASVAGDRVEGRLRRLTAKLRADVLGGHYSPAKTVFLATDDRRFLLRQRKPGDTYRPLGGPGRSSIQNMLINRKVVRELRDRLPVVCSSEGLPIWVPGLPPANELAVQPTSKLVVQLTYSPAGTIVMP